MPGIRWRGGAFATFTKHAKTREQTVLVFSQTVSRRIKELGLRQARVEFFRGRLKITFSKDSKKREKWQKLSYRRPDNRALLYVNDLTRYFSSDLSLDQRKGMVSWNGNNELFVVFPFLFGSSIFPHFSKRRPLEGKESFDNCTVYISARYGCARLRFWAKTSQRLFQEKIKGLAVSFEGHYLFLNPEKGCLFDCSHCPRLDCLALNFERRKNYIRASFALRHLLSHHFPFESLAQLPKEERRGKVYWPPGRELIVIDFPFLGSGSKHS